MCQAMPSFSIIRGDIGTFLVVMVALFAFERIVSETLNANRRNADFFGALIALSGIGKLCRDF
jgi:hypothetical protein